MTALRFEVGCAKCGSEVRLGGGSAGCESRPHAVTDVRRQVVCTRCRAEFVVAAVMLPINRQDAQRDLTPAQVLAAKAQHGSVRAAAAALNITERRAYRIVAKAQVS